MVHRRIRQKNKAFYNNLRKSLVFCFYEKYRLFCLFFRCLCYSLEVRLEISLLITEQPINMQVANENPTLTLTVRHETVTEALRDFVQKKVASLDFDYPKIIEAKVVLDVHKSGHHSEVILYCANHITIDASSCTDDMYNSINETFSKISRRMRKQKTRLLRKQKSAKNREIQSIRYLDERVFDDLALDHPEESQQDPEPVIVHKENYKLKTLLKEDALMELELSDRPFLLFKNARRDILQIVYRRADGEFSIVNVPEQS